MTIFFLLLVAASLVLASIALTPLSTRLGMPVLLLFFVVGMIAGEDGLGGIRFDDFDAAFFVANIALAVILLDGGMRTKVETFRVALKPAASLATLGVLITAGITGVAAIWLLDLPPLVGLLMGSIVASTDAAAVFSLLQGRGLHLNERVSATLEIESGSNDPMAIFLTVMFVDMISKGEGFGLGSLWLLLSQFGVGAVGGLIGGWLLALLVRKLDLAEGLYALLAISGGLVIFAVTGLLNGSGFLAIYLAGLWLGNSRVAHLRSILQVHDGLAWLAQLGLFLILGLLVVPSQMMDVLLPALGLSLVLMLVARPISVVLGLLPFRPPWREQFYISWVGLRGAVPIVLALFPVMAQLEEAQLLFNVTCIVVLVSLLLQGSSLTWMARLLKLEVPAPRLPERRIPLGLPEPADHELFLLPMAQVRGGPMPVRALKLPREGALLTVFRDGKLRQPTPEMELRADDWLAVAAHGSDAAEVGQLLSTGEQPPRQAIRTFFGDFTLSGDALLGDLGIAYGFPVEPELSSLSLSEVIARRHHGHPVVGDRIAFEPVQLVVMATAGDRVTRVGLKLPDPE